MRYADQALLRYREDRRSLLFVALTLLLLLLPLAVSLAPWLQPVWLLFSSLFCFNACIVNHNHVHCPVFVSQGLNTCFGLFLSLAKGHSSSGVIQAHNDNHHRHQGGPDDWIHPGLAGRGIGILRLLRYILLASLSMAQGRRQAGSVQSRLRRRRLRLERFTLTGFALLLLAVAGTDALLFVGLPWLLGICMLVGVNLLQHDGCDAKAGWRHSRNFTGALGNWFFFNNGYHTLHHIDPGMHWSRLAAAHQQRVKAHLPADLQQPSIMLYLLQQYIFRFADRRDASALERA